MSANWEFWMFDNDGPNQMRAAMRHLDREMGPFMEINHFRYGLQTIVGGTNCLKGYINFFTNQDEDKVRAMLPGFNINPVNRLEVIELHHYLSNYCYWSKLGVRQSEPGKHIIVVYVECHYHDVVMQQNPNDSTPAQ